MIHGRRIEDRVGGQVLHGHLHHAQHKQIGSREPHEPVGHQAEEMGRAGGELIGALAQLVQLPLGVRPKVDVRDEEAADEEKSVHAERPVGDGLEKEVLLHLLAHLHVVRVLEDHDARVPQDHPGHAERP